jgi:cobalt/nickel transport system ATP-binding protein
VNSILGPSAIEAQNIRFAYPDGIEAIADLSFHAGEGEIVAVLGANGSGKTTLLKVLMRLLQPRQGKVFLGGIDIGTLQPNELYRRMGMVFQNPADQLFGASVGEDVAFGPRNQNLSEAEVVARVEESLAAVDALGLRHRPIHHLSYGQQKRVALAGVLAMQPGVLLLDEPTAGLDPVGQSQMIELLMRLNHEQKVTLIIATHCIDLLSVLAHRVYVLSQGRVWQEGSPREVLADPDRAAQVGLRIPLIAQLFHRLQHQDGIVADTIPLTVAEARQQILQWLAKDSVTATGEGGRP